MRGERERKRRRSVLDTRDDHLGRRRAAALRRIWFFAFAGSSLPGA